MQQETHRIRVVTKKAYSVFQKLFCCMCFHCLRADDETMLTSDIRKQTFQRMIKNFVIQNNISTTTTLFDPLKLMIIIYLCEDKQIPHQLIQRCRINPDMQTTRNRTDLEFYIPQICNFLVFHEDLKNTLLLEDMLSCCKTNYFFAHLYYFYINSLEKIVNKSEIITINQVTKYKKILADALSKEYQHKLLHINDIFLGLKNKLQNPGKQAVYDNIQKYGTVEQDECHKLIQIEAADILLPNYVSIYSQQIEQLVSFKSTINFFQDLFRISDDLKTADPKSKALKHLLRKMNEKLPACVYVPFAKDAYRSYNILNIVASESRVFSTKERAPFYICLQIFKPSQTLSSEDCKRIDQEIGKPRTLKSRSNKFNSETHIDKRKSMEQTALQKTKRTSMKSQLLLQYRDSVQTEILETPKVGKFLTNKLLEFTNSMETSHKVDRDPIEMKQIFNAQQYSEKLGKIFGEKEENMRSRIKASSIYSSIKTWSLLHLMIKTGDNLKQQQFALQLIYQFHYIFKLENLPLILTPYEVISMGPDCGVMEMVKDAITIDGLLKKLNQDYPKILSLKQFFEAFFYKNLNKAKQNFTRSLAAYSVVMYFLQVKDRHNGNILLHRDGRILHIDFGFLLSNAPGKGVQLQKSAPFKLNTQYIQVMDGIQSSYFEEFRKYFYQGFKAASKHQDRILILVKMMYSSSGTTMPCFQKGEQTIKQLQQRFNPPNIINDLQLSQHCQKLINLSLDNWATRWYDKWQYWAQGIFY